MKKTLLSLLLLGVAALTLAQVTPTGRITKTFPPSGATTGSIGSSGPQSPSTLLNGLVTVWPLSSDGSDLVGGKTLTNNGGVTFVAKGGGAPAGMPATVANFAGAQSMSVADPFYLPIGTYSAWAYVNAAGATRAIVAKDDTGAQRDFEFYVLGSGAYEAFAWNTVGGTASANVTGFTAATWHHVLFEVTAANEIKIQLDGGTVGTSSLGDVLRNGTSPLYIGALNGGFVFWNGLISSVIVWSRTLTATEKACLEAGAFYPFTGVCS